MNGFQIRFRTDYENWNFTFGEIFLHRKVHKLECFKENICDMKKKTLTINIRAIYSKDFECVVS